MDADRTRSVSLPSLNPVDGVDVFMGEASEHSVGFALPETLESVAPGSNVRFAELATTSTRTSVFEVESQASERRKSEPQMKRVYADKTKGTSRSTGNLLTESQQLGSHGGYVPVEVKGFKPEDWGFGGGDFYRSSSQRRLEYKFSRSGATRRSLYEQRMGEVLPTNAGVGDGREVDIYLSLNSRAQVEVFMALVMGLGALNVPGAFVSIGIIPGLSFLLALSGLNHFLCNRLVAVPELLESNFETCTTIMKFLIGRNLVVWGVLFMSTFTWFCACVLNAWELGANMRDAHGYIEVDWATSSSRNITVPEDLEGWEIRSLGRKVLFTIFVLFCSHSERFFATYMKARPLAPAARTTATVIVIMLIAGCLGAIYVIAMAVNEGRFQRVAWFGKDGERLVGLHLLLFAYLGSGFLPFIVQEMVVDPNGKSVKEAKMLIHRSIRNIAILYAVFGVLGSWGLVNAEGIDLTQRVDGDIGWGRDLVIQIINYLRSESELGTGWVEFSLWTSGYVILFLFILKGAAGCVVFFWPLLQEVTVFLQTMESPPVEINLPWATDWSSRERRMCRYAVTMIACVPALMQDSLQGAFPLFCRLLVDLPMNVTHLLVPAVVACSAAFMHRGMMRFKEVRRETMRRIHAAGGYSRHTNTEYVPTKTELYVGKSYRIHSVVAVLSVVITCSLTAFLSTKWMCMTLGLHFMPRFAQSFASSPICRPMESDW